MLLPSFIQWKVLNLKHILSVSPTYALFPNVWFSREPKMLSIKMKFLTHPQGSNFFTEYDRHFFQHIKQPQFKIWFPKTLKPLKSLPSMLSNFHFLLGFSSFKIQSISKYTRYTTVEHVNIILKYCE